MRSAIAVIVLCLVLPGALYAQEDVLRPSGTKKPKPKVDPPTRSATIDSTTPHAKWFVGVSGGLSRWMLSQSITDARPQSPVEVYESASGLSPIVSAQVHFAIWDWLRIGLVGGYSPLNAAGELNGAIAEGAITDPVSGYAIAYKDVRVNMNTSYEMSAAFVGADVQWLPIGGLVISVGPILQFASSPLTITTTQAIAPGETFRFWDGDSWSTSVTTVEVIHDVLSPVFGLNFGVAYEVPVTEMISIVPRLSYVLLGPLMEQRTRIDGSRIYSSGPVRYTAGPLEESSLRATIVIVCNFGH